MHELEVVQPLGGYVQGNVRLITNHMNKALNIYGQEEFERMIKAYQEHNGGS